jgi:hypothetical protein
MSRRWYRYAGKVVFFGWDAAERGFYMNLVDLCPECHGTGEVADTEEVCPGCGGEGIQLNRLNPSSREGGLSLEQLAAAFGDAGMPLTQEMRRDLAADEQANAASLLHEYELET